MTIDEVPLDRPNIGTGFSVICGFCRLRLSEFILKFSAEIFAPYGRFLPESVFSEFLVSPDNFAVPSANGNTSFAWILRG